MNQELRFDSINWIGFGVAFCGLGPCLYFFFVKRERTLTAAWIFRL